MECISHFFLCVRKSRGGQVDKIEDLAEEGDRGGGGETGLRDGGTFESLESVKVSGGCSVVKQASGSTVDIMSSVCVCMCVLHCVYLCVTLLHPPVSLQYAFHSTADSNETVAQTNPLHVACLFCLVSI